ncbi:MAG: hypothetical protein ACFFED_01150 [Candidatus Thorarchaeota archaeon]
MTAGTEILWTIKDQEGIEGRTLAPSRIEVLDRLLKANYGFEVSVESLERLRSKKNIVLHLVLKQDLEEFDVVAKLFIEKSFEIEVDVLDLGARTSLMVPSKIASQDEVLLMGYIDGSLLVDTLNESFDISLIEGLAQWYHEFHQKTRHVKGDPRLRNFLVSNGIIYGFDFEEYREAHWMEDIGGIAASILDTRPVFDARKVKLAWHLLETYLSLSGMERNVSIDSHFTRVIADTLEQTAKWRDDNQILAHSRRVRQYGLSVE